MTTSTFNSGSNWLTDAMIHKKQPRPFSRKAISWCVLFVGMLSFASYSAAYEEISHEEVLKFVFSNITKSTIAYSQRVQHCDLIALDHVPKLDKGMLDSLNVSRENALIALGYFSFKNDLACVRSERSDLAYQIDSMEYLKNLLQDDWSSEEKLKYETLYPTELEVLIDFPPPHVIDMQIKYSKLSDAQRAYFESVLRDKPINLPKTIEANSLSL